MGNFHKLRIGVFLFLAFAVSAFEASGSVSGNVQAADSLSGVEKRVSSLESLFGDYLKFDGYMKLRNEYDTGDGNYRFVAKNLRMGIRGDVTDFLSYRVQFDLAHKFTMLDAYAAFKPLKGMQITFGQNVIPFFNIPSITPGMLWFSDAPLFTKYSPFSVRDMGISVSYSFMAGKLPVYVVAGYYTGCNMNDQKWRNKPSYSAKVQLGKASDGLRFAAKAMLNDREENLAGVGEGIYTYFNWGAELDYFADSFKIGAEYTNHNNLDHRLQISNILLQGAYIFRLPEKGAFKSIVPAVKWDSVGYGVLENGLEINRLTAGITCAFEYGKIASHLRLDYEYGLTGNLPDLLVVEVQVAF